MSDKDDKTGIDWSIASDEQLAQAAAELKKRRPLTDFEGENWANMNETEFAQKREEVFGAMRQHAKDRRVQKENAEYLAEKEVREARANA